MVTNLHSKATSEDTNGAGKHVTDLIDKSDVQDTIIVDLNTKLYRTAVSIWFASQVLKPKLPVNRNKQRAY